MLEPSAPRQRAIEPPASAGASVTKTVSIPADAKSCGCGRVAERRAQTGQPRRAGLLVRRAIEPSLFGHADESDAQARDALADPLLLRQPVLEERLERRDRAAEEQREEAALGVRILPDVEKPSADAAVHEPAFDAQLVRVRELAAGARFVLDPTLAEMRVAGSVAPPEQARG